MSSFTLGAYTTGAATDIGGGALGPHGKENQDNFFVIQNVTCILDGH